MKKNWFSLDTCMTKNPVYVHFSLIPTHCGHRLISPRASGACKFYRQDASAYAFGDYIPATRKIRQPREM